MVRALLATLSLCFVVMLAACDKEPVNISEFGLPNDSTPTIGSLNGLDKAPARVGVRKMALSAGEVPDGEALSPPAVVRFWRLWGTTFPYSCKQLLADEWTEVLNKSFTTGDDTTYVELQLSGQFTIASGTDANGGIAGRAILDQGTGPTGALRYVFPGMGTEFDPWLARRDVAGNGQQIYGGYQGIVGADADTDSEIILSMKSTDNDGWVCFLNMTVRMD